MQADAPRTFTVHTHIGGKGSRTVGVKKDGSKFTRPASDRQAPFADAVAKCAVAAGVPLSYLEQGISVVWYAPRPASQCKADGTPRTHAPMRPSGTDRDKVLRNICDALEGIAWPHDRLVRVQAIDAHFGAPARCEITVFTCPRNGHWKYEATP